MPPLLPASKDEEADRIKNLYPRNKAFFDGPPAFPETVSFYAYASCQITLNQPYFRQSLRWLLWALAHTKDRHLIVAINCALCVVHGKKARHLGGGACEVLSPEEDFQRMQLDSRKMKLVPLQP